MKRFLKAILIVFLIITVYNRNRIIKAIYRTYNPEMKLECGIME